ncbi:MAG: hypothetical protein NVSMB55_27900 [Mycobacteriales bacterium]
MTATTVPDRIDCPTCSAPYRPQLTAGTCPVCDSPPPAGSSHRPRWFDASRFSPDDRLLAIVVVGTVLNVLLLGLLAALATHS